MQIFKKADKTYCTNYQEVTYISYKIFSILLYKRTALYIELKTGDYQHGVRANRSTRDQFFLLKTNVREAWEHKLTLNLFIDFKTAYGSLS